MPGVSRHHFTHQSTTNTVGRIFGQLQFAGEGEEGEDNLLFICREAQFDPGVLQPLVVLEQCQHQSEEIVVHDMDMESF
ncbi:hypothetical protein D3C85_1171590 [compost metagenome]